MNNPKKHHFVPESYLSGFTLSNRKNGKLWVIDQLKISIRPSTPKNEAHKRYLYRVKVMPEGDEFGVEKGLSQFEGLSIPVLKEIGKSRCIPSGKKYNLLMNYLTLQIVRTPKFRANLERMSSELYDKVGKTGLYIITQSKEYFDKYIDDMLRRKPHLKKTDFDYDKIKDSIKNITIGANIDQNYHVKHSLKTIDTILPLLGKRKWSILTPENNDSYFITSDNPVVLTWSDPKNNDLPLGFGLLGTDVIFPITKSVAIIGRFESNTKKNTLDNERLALINNCFANASKRFLYSCEKEVLWFKPNEKIGNLTELFDFIRGNIGKDNKNS